MQSLRPVGTKLSRCPATVCRARLLRRDRDEVGDRRFDGVPGPANTHTWSVGRCIQIGFGAVLGQAACREYSLISPCTRVRLTT